MRGKNLIGIYLATMLILSLASINLSLASPQTTIQISPSEIRVDLAVANEITLEIYVTEASGIHGWQVRIGWDVSLTEFPPILSDPPNPEIDDIVEGDFLLHNGNLTTGEEFWDPTAGVWMVADFAGGFIQLTGNIVGPGVALDNEGTLVYVTLKLKESGTSDIHLFDTMLWDADLEPIDHETQDGFFYTTNPYITWTVTPSNPLPGEIVTFNASASYDPDNTVEGADPDPGPLVDFAWDFGDGSTAHGEVVMKVFMDYRFDPYAVTLTVTDDDGDVWSKTKGLSIWRDIVMVDIWFDITWWLDSDVREMARGANALILLTTTNVGTQTETFDVTLTMTNDETGEEAYVEAWWGTMTLGPGTGSGWSMMAGYYYTGEPAGDYTMSAEVIGPEEEPNKANNVLSIPIRLTEADLIEASIAVEGDTLTLSGKAKNMESLATAEAGLYTWIRFEVLTPEGDTVILDTSAEFVTNEQETGVLTASMEAGLGDYAVTAYAVYSTMSPGDIAFYEQFAWPGALEGTSETVESFTFRLPGADLIMAQPDTRHFKISNRGDTLTFYGKAKNTEKMNAPTAGLYAWIRFEVMDELGILLAVLDTPKEYIENAEETGTLTASMKVEAGEIYYVTAYAVYSTTLQDDVSGEWETISVKQRTFTVSVAP